jgi:hypothetical protein
MTVTVQTQLSGVTDPDLQWVDSAAGVTLKAKRSTNYAMTWSGTVTLPVARGSQPFRIRITETEFYPYEPAGGATTYAERITYLDTIDI